MKFNSLLKFCIYFLYKMPMKMVEAAGIEPASASPSA